MPSLFKPGTCAKKLLIILTLLIAFFPALLQGHAAAAPSLHQAKVTAVNDGDTVTIFLEGKEHRCRLIGFDAPEMGQEPWGRRSREHLRGLLKASRWKITVETDLEKYDKYNRLLVYLRTPDNVMINERMLTDGYAVLFTIQPNSRYVERFKKAQHQARQEKRGIWGPNGLKERPLDYKKAHPRTESRKAL